MIALAKAALVLSLVPGVLGSTQIPALGATRAAAAAGLHVNAKRPVRQPSAAVTRTTERKLLALAPRVKLLRRFVDHTTGLVKRNVTAHCARFHRKGSRPQLHRFLCRVWVQPRSPASGVAVVCHTAHHAFRVTAYHRRHRHHRR